jgi:hypothetical protein
MTLTGDFFPGSSRFTTSYRTDGMHTFSKRICQYQDWWDNRASRGRRESGRSKHDCVLQLPLPSFPPALNFDASLFALPPAYEDVFDLEKAIHPAQPPSGRSSHASTIYQDKSLQKLYSAASISNQDSFHSPIARHVRVIRCLRYSIFTVYRRLFTFVFAMNLIGVFILLRQHQNINEDRVCTTLATLASSNFLVAILIRQDYLINLLFRSAWLLPWSAPPSIRKAVARVYCYGGVHSGAAVAGTIWWIPFTAMTSRLFLQSASTFSITAISWTLLFLLLTILLLSYPAVRSRYHNTFEITHRFLGWISIALFWVQLLLLTLRTSDSLHQTAILLIHNPTFWNLTLITLLLIYPWLRIRRWTFTAHVLSSHAIRLSFPNPIHKFSCLSISSSPLLEWHPFATFPSRPNETSMVVSNAGDWTREIIGFARTQVARQSSLATTRTLPTREKGDVKLTFFTRPHPRAGILSLSLLHPRILILTTGSGIGPALSSLLERPASQFARLVWASRSPLLTYGRHMLDLVKRADPEAVVLDTDERGRPDLLELAWREGRRDAVDAVFVLSNERVVKWVVGGLVRRGVLAYGPSWES